VKQDMKKIYKKTCRKMPLVKTMSNLSEQN